MDHTETENRRQGLVRGRTLGRSRTKGLRQRERLTVWESGITALGKQCLKNSSRLQEVTVPEGVRSIGAEAFKNCTALRRVTLPRSLETIGEEAFMADLVERARAARTRAQGNAPAEGKAPPEG